MSLRVYQAILLSYSESHLEVSMIDKIFMSKTRFLADTDLRFIGINGKATSIRGSAMVECDISSITTNISSDTTNAGSITFEFDYSFTDAARNNIIRCEDKRFQVSGGEYGPFFSIDDRVLTEEELEIPLISVLCA